MARYMPECSCIRTSGKERREREREREREVLGGSGWHQIKVEGVDFG